MSLQFDLAQSFFVDREAVSGSSTIGLTSVELFFNDKPAAGKSKTGIYKPGVSVYICPMENEQPNLSKVIEGTTARVEWDNITTSATAATATKFTFQRPVLLATNASYAFLVKFDGSDNDFRLWWAKDGENYINTNISASVNSGYNDGNFFIITNGNVLTKTSSADLKFKINIAKLTSLSQTYKFRERGYELFRYYANTVTGSMKTGEYVYKNTASLTGNAVLSSSSRTVTGQNGTTFNTDYAAGDYIVFTDGTSGNSIVRVVESVSSASSMVIDERPHFSNATGVGYLKTAVATVYLDDKTADHMILTDSNANSSIYFDNDDYVKGEDSGAQVRIQVLKDFDISRVMSQINVITPAYTSTNTAVGFANATYDISSSQVTSIPPARRVFIDSESIIGSRSLLTTSGGTLFANNTSVNGSISLTSTNQYCSPYIEESDVDLFVYRYQINDDATNEELGNGAAVSRYISKVVTLGINQFAEDMRVYLNAYVPAGTSIKVYGKVVNPNDYEPFASKNWSLLEEVNPAAYTSSPKNKSDTVEKEYQIPFYRNDGTTLSGYGSMTTPNNTISTTSDLSSNLSSGSLIRVYQEGSQNNFFVSAVSSVNSTAITITDTISNTSFNGSMKIEKISDVNKNAAFINPQNRNVVRYYTTDMAPLDTYNKFALKIVLLSDSVWSAPLVKDVRAIAVSA